MVVPKSAFNEENGLRNRRASERAPGSSARVGGSKVSPSSCATNFKIILGDRCKFVKSTDRNRGQIDGINRSWAINEVINV